MIDLPTAPYPAPVTIAWSLVDFGGRMRGALGGIDQRINRLGGRWAVELTLPPMEAADARVWTTKLNRGLRLGVRWKIHQPDLTPGSPGTALVNGASQGGTQIVADGFTPGYVVRIGQKFSLLDGGHRYVHEIAEVVRADATGNATLEIEPPLRTSPADNAVLEFGVPYIEGLLLEPVSGQFTPDAVARGLSFIIEEAR